jgi:heme/copper-type cytochrome/quinol oxidase subunit 2
MLGTIRHPNLNIGVLRLAKRKFQKEIFLRRAILHLVPVIALLTAVYAMPPVLAQSPEASAEWALFNQILFIGIIVGLVVFGLMFYAIIRYREKPHETGAS